jgi:hypothetical protein
MEVTREQLMEVTREQLASAFAQPSVRIAIDRLSARGELAVMDQIASLLRHHSERSRRRVLAWARDYLLDAGEPPF